MVVAQMVIRVRQGRYRLGSFEGGRGNHVERLLACPERILNMLLNCERVDNLFDWEAGW